MAVPFVCLRFFVQWLFALVVCVGLPAHAGGFAWHVYSVNWPAFTDLAHGKLSVDDRASSLRQLAAIETALPDEYVKPAKAILAGGFQSWGAQRVSACAINHIVFHHLMADASIYPKLAAVVESDGLSHDFVSMGVSKLSDPNRRALGLFQLGRNYERSTAIQQCYKSPRDEDVSIRRRECACDFGPDPSYVALAPLEVAQMHDEVVLLLEGSGQRIGKESPDALASLQELLAILKKVAATSNRGLVFGTNN